MIYRKIFRSKVRYDEDGTRSPEIFGKLRGLSGVVLEYSDDGKSAIVEIILVRNQLSMHNLTPAVFDELAKEPCVLEVLDSHPKSPEVITQIRISDFPDRPAEMRPVSRHVATRKEITYQGKIFKYLRAHEYTSTAGERVIDYIIEEG